MASHKGWDFLFPVTGVATSGGSFNLGKAQLGLVDLEGNPTATNGLRLIDSLSGLKKDRKLQLRIGKHDIMNNRSQSGKDWSSETFRVTDIMGLKVDAPKAGIGVDAFTLGYNGIDDDSAIVLDRGANEEISVTICGEVIGALGYSQSEVEVKLYLDQPNSGDLKTMQEIIETAVAQFNNYKLMGDIPVTNYVKAIPVNSENESISGNANYFYTLTVEDEGDSNALSAVQSQYDVKVLKTDRVGTESIYTVLGVAPTEVNAGSFVVGEEYVITSVGTTDFQAIGANADEVGEVFTATGVGSGTGTADTVEITGFKKTKAWKVKGCADCPSGYSEYTDGYVYSVSIEDDGSDSTTAVEAISSNVEADSAIRVSLDGGLSTYTFVVDQELTDAEKNTFITSNEEAEFSLISKNASEVCAPSNTTTFNWVQSEEPCYTKTADYTITLEDTKCGDDLLDELNKAYPELTITVDTAGGCKTRYKTSVVTNLVCENCDDIYRDLFVSEAPQDYNSKPWIGVTPTYSEDAKMGIQFVAQPIEFYGSEVYRDDMPFFATSARLKIAGGASRDINESFYQGLTGRFELTVDSIATEPENWGGNLRELEDITKRRQEGVSRHEGNNYAKWILGEETVLKAGVPYVDYILTIRLKSFAQSLSGEKNETFNYHFAVEPGAHIEVEKLLNMLAAEAGVDTVQAYAKDA